MLEVHAKEVHDHVDSAPASVDSVGVEEPGARAKQLEVDAGRNDMPARRLEVLAWNEGLVLLQVIGEFAQDDQAVQTTPTLQGPVINRCPAQCSLPRTPSGYSSQRDPAKIVRLLTVSKFWNNARRDNLERFWKGQFGYTHGILVVNAFYENVNLHKAEGGELAEGEAVQNLVLEFRPKPTQDMLVACLWSKWTGTGEPDLLSFAAITDEPPEEVAAAGHDRCIIPIRPENIDAWLKPNPQDLASLYAILDDRERPYYEHRMAA